VDAEGASYLVWKIWLEVLVIGVEIDVGFAPGDVECLTEHDEDAAEEASLFRDI
jgi:hypothetical protein